MVTPKAYSQQNAWIRSTTSDIPTTPIVPFCPTTGFTVGGTIEWNKCSDVVNMVEVYVILEVRPLDNYRLDGPFVNADQFFSVIQYNGGSGSPALQGTFDLTGNGKLRKGFKFLFPVMVNDPIEYGGIFSASFPFKFNPVYFFGDHPWKVQLYARNLCDPMPIDLTDLNNDLDEYSLAGTLAFEAPYYPIKGTQNISQYPELTAYSKDAGRAHSIMLLPDDNGNPPVLTIDQTLFPIGFNGPMVHTNFNDRGNIYMCPGAQIKVADGKTFEVFANMFTCDLTNQVSKGIVVESGGTLKMSSSRIKDAEVAVHVKRGGTLDCGTTDFLNNYLHIKLDNTGSTGNDLQAYFGPLMQIHTMGSIKGQYPGMATPEAPQGRGLELLQVPTVDVGSAQFSNLNNGIYADRSSIFIRGSFTNIQPAAVAYPVWQGWAIFAKGSGVEKIDYNGGGTDPMTDDIDNCDRGIYVDNMDAGLRGLEISANQGIYLQNCRNNQVIVSGNPKIDCKLYGIQSRLCLPTDQMSRINGNTISIALPGNTLPTGRGINLQEFYGVTEPNGTKGWWLYNNNITLDRAYTGIRYSGGNNSGFWNNHITLIDKTYDPYIGFELQSSKQLTLGCNEVGPPTGSSSSFGTNSTGYRISNISGTSYTGNKTSRTGRGMAFVSMCDASVLRANEFELHTQGLSLAANVALGEQGKDYQVAGNIVYVQDNGNCWTNSNAFHAATNATAVRQSAFGVDPAEMACFLPPNNQGSIWFSQEITPTQSTYALNSSSCSPPPNFTSPPGGGKVDQAVADGSILTAGLPGVTDKMLENHLYARLMESDAGLASQYPFKDFLAAKVGSTTESFYLVRRGIDGLANFSTTQQATTSATRSQLYTARTALFILDSLKALGKSILPSDYTKAWQDLAGFTADLRNQLQVIQGQKTTEANQLLGQNSAIVTSVDWENNEKAVNELAIRMFLQDQSLTTTQLAQLDNLAALCPDNGGEAVLRARILYNLFIEKAYENICERSTGPSASTLPRSIQVWPNPTTGRIFLPDAKDVERELRVFDMTGRQVFYQTTTDTVIDLSLLANGVYHLQLFDQATGSLGTIKVIIQK